MTTPSDTLHTSSTDDAATVVRGLLAALSAEDYDGAAALLAPDARWENVGLPAVVGRDRIVGLCRRGRGRIGFEVVSHRIVAQGTTVMTERTDALIVGRFRLQFWVCGVFELRDGQITLWRDYADVLTMLRATVRGLVGVAVPALRPKF